jgi:hypothetical protein
MYLRFVLLLALITFWGVRLTAQTPSAMPNASYVCNFAKVKIQPKKDDYIAVRSGAGTKYRKIGRLHPGRVVYICDEDRDWFKVFYGDPGSPCGSVSNNGLDVQGTKGCRSGWVGKKWIDVVSG